MPRRGGLHSISLHLITSGAFTLLRQVLAGLAPRKEKQWWAHSAPLALVTMLPAARLVKFAGVSASQQVLDVACGTGVVAITAARLGAKVAGLDLTPELLERARYAHLNALPRHLPAPIHALGSECSPRWSEPVQK